MKTFLGYNRPVLTTMLKGKCKKELMFEIDVARLQGTDAFGMQIDLLPTVERNRTDLKDLFDAMGDKPAYITNYTRGNISEKPQSDEELVEEMYMALECGATLFDLRADTFDRQPDEFSTDEKAIARQMEVVKTVHSMGKEVLMSTHTLKYTTPERIMEIMKAQEARGADICKLVTNADTDEEEFQAFENLFALSRGLKVPYLYLINGEKNLRHRRLSSALGNYLFLTTIDGKDGITQPPLSVAKAMLNTIEIKDLP